MYVHKSKSTVKIKGSSNKTLIITFFTDNLNVLSMLLLRYVFQATIH